MEGKQRMTLREWYSKQVKYWDVGINSRHSYQVIETRDVDKWGFGRIWSCA